VSYARGKRALGGVPVHRVPEGAEAV
jgi:hypothetical protein